MRYLLAIFVLGLCAITTMPAFAQDFKPPYPFTRQQLWENILKIAALPDGYVTHSDVERSFGITLKPPAKRGPKGDNSPVYLVIGGVSWYFDMSVDEKSTTLSDFYFAWGKPPGAAVDQYTGQPTLPTGMCITPDDVTSGLRATGWELVGRTPDKSWIASGVWEAMPDIRRYHKDKRGMVYVEFQAGCLANIAISATDYPQY